MLVTIGSNKWLPIVVEVVLVVAAAAAVVDGIVLDLVAFRMGQILEVAHYKPNIIELSQCKPIGQHSKCSHFGSKPLTCLYDGDLVHLVDFVEYSDYLVVAVCSAYERYLVC